MFLFLTIYLLCSAHSTLGNVVVDVTSDVKLNVDGIIAAYGDFDSDRLADVFLIGSNGETLEIYTWNSKKVFFSAYPSATINAGAEIVGVAVADFNGDGNMDVLVSTKQRNITGFIFVEVYFGDTKQLIPANFNIKMKDQPTIMDVNGDLYPDLYGTNQYDSRTYWIWTPIEGSFGFHAEPQLNLPSLISPNSNGFVDITNDFHADLVIFSKSSSNNEVLIEVWKQVQHNFTLDSTVVLSTLGAKLYGMLSFADIDSDGVIDVLLPVCMTVDCSQSSLYVIYSADGLLKTGQWKVILNNDNADWKFPADDMKEDVRIPFKVHFADLNMDNLPDGAAILQRKNDGRRFVAYMLNKRCIGTHCNSTIAMQVEEFLPGSGVIELPVSVSFMDVYENGGMDIMITCRNKINDNKYYLKVLKNNFNTDTAFLKVAVLSGLQSTAKYGAVQVGASVYMETKNTDGLTITGKAAQLSQSSYFSLQLPYVVFGLGKSPNFVEEIRVGVPTTSKDVKRVKSWTAILPNAQVIVIPNPPDKPHEWVTKLLVTPSKLLLQTGGVLIGTCLLIAGIILILHIKEKREDEAEKRREAHKFHFDAL